MNKYFVKTITMPGTCIIQSVFNQTFVLLNIYIDMK